MLKNTTLKNGTGVNNMTYEFAHLHVDNGEAKLAQGGWNTFWNIHSLTGEGSFTWDSGSTHSTSNVLTLDGEGDFSGTIHFFRNHSGGGASRRFQAFTAIGHDYAVQSAVVKMTGTDNDNYGALAINTAEAHMKGLTTDANNKNYNVIYAGAALTTPQDGAPASTREAALHLDVDGGNSFTFRGGVSGDAAHALSVIKSGAGSQTFADGDGTYSTAATFRDVTVLGGTLNLTHTTTTITGDYAIAQGATLNVNGGITLAEGHTLAALATAGDTGTATLGSALTLAGGTLSFSGEGLGSLAENTYLLSLASVGKAEGQTALTVDFMDASYLQAGRTYLLAGGDFASLELTYTATGVDFLTASFSATREGLSVTWNALPDNLIWDGTDSAHTWTTSVFGTQGIPDGTFTSQNFMFTNAAANKNVVVGDELSDIKGMDISGSGYTFSGGAVSVAGGLTLRANASATFAQALHVGGDVSLADASKLILAAGESVFSLTNESTGTLEVQSGASADLGSVQGTANYHLAGSGDISLTVGDAMYIFASTSNEFNGKLTIDLGTAHHFLMGEDNATGSNFAAGYRPNLVLKGGNASNAGLILNNCYAGAEHALEIGSLSSGDDKFNVHIRGDWGDNPSGQAYRFVSAHQDTDTDFRGIFDDKTDKGQLRSIGLIMNGAGEVGGGTLTLLGNSQSTATLIINSGTVAIAGTGGHWHGDVVVNGGGQLFIHRTSGALNAGKSLTITGNGVAEFTDASGTLHEARPGALKLANGVDLAPSVTVLNPGASVMTEQNVTATISGAITGSGNLTKIGAGTLTLSGTSTGTGHLDVEQGTLTLVNGSTWAGDIIVENGANLNTDGTGVFNVGGSITRDYRSGTHSGPISALATGTPSTINIGDGTAINLIGGDFSGVGRVIGGVLLTAGSNGKGAHISGVSQVNLDGADLSGATLYGGSELNQYQCTQGISSEKTEVNLRSGSVNTVYGGHLMDSSGNGELQNVSIGSALVTLDGATVSGNIYGGSRVIRNNSDSTVTQGAVTVDLNSGSLAGSVYAGGKQDGSSKLQTASTEVKISNEVRFTGTNQIISGGYEVAEGKSGSTITGSRTLTLSSEGAYTNLGGLAFKEFDIIDSSATSATLANFTNTGSLVKKGEGAVTISPAQSLGTLTVEAGSIGFSGGAAFTGAVTVAEGATLSLTGAISLSSAISSDGTVDFSNVRFSLSAQDFTDNRFDILTGNGTSTGNLTLADITLVGISDPVRLLGMGGGNVYVILGAARSLVWNGSETDSGKLWSGANWLNNNMAGASFTGGDNVTFTAAAGCKRVDVGAEGVVTSDMTIANAAEYAFEGAAVNVSGNLSLEANAKARFHNSLAVQGSVSLASGSTLSLHQNASLTVAANNANTGTLEVYNGAAVDLGDVSGTAKYHLDGAGTVRMNVTGGDYILSSTGNTFSGKLEINLGGRHFIIGAGGNNAATFAEDATPDLVLSGGSGSSQFIINSNYHGTDHVLNIGSLASESASVDIHAQNGANPDNENHRYLSIHQDTDTTYAGRFLNAGKQGDTGGLRGAGLIMNGTGTLTLTGNNNSMADLIVSSGTVALSGSGYWKGDVTVGAGGQLYLQKDGALNSAQSLTISGNGVAAFTDASGVYHAARVGALKLDDGRVLAHAVTIGEGGASIATVEGATTTISGAISGQALTKAGDGTLRLTGAVTAESISVADGTLSLGGNVTLNAAIANDSIVDFSGVHFTLNAGTSSGDRYDIVTGGGTTTGHLTLDAITISGVADTSTLRLGGVGTGHVFVLAGAGDLTWNGSLTEGGGTWGGLNWTMGSDNTDFRTGDSTYFTAAAANKNVEVTAGGVGTNQMVISANGYTFTGGAITATGGLTLSEDVTATFANDGLTVEGALTVQGESATLSVAEGKTVTISGTATGGDLVVAGGGTVSISATGSVSNNVSVAAGSRLDLASGTSLDSGAGLTLAGTLGLADGVTLGNTLASNNGAIAVETGATATFTGASSGSLTKAGEGTLALSREGAPAYGTWNLDAGTLRVDQSGSIVLNTGDTHTGTLEVAAGKTINLGTVSGDVFYHLAGSGTINLTANGDGHVYLKSTGNTFSGTLNIALSGKHVIIGEENNSAAANFTASAMPDLVLTGGSSGSMLILNSNYHGEDSVLNIGSLTGGASVTISAANGTNPSGDYYRYVSVHQDADTTFQGLFQNTDKGRAVGLMKNGHGTLTLTGNNLSEAKLIINSGTVQLGEASGSTGKWSGDVTVKNGGQLSIQRTGNGALASGKTLSIAGTGVAAWTDAEGTEHAARKGALVLGNGVTVTNAITIDAAGASVMVGGNDAATINSSLSGGTLTKTGAGTLSVTNAVSGNFIVEEGTLNFSSYLYQNVTGIDLRADAKLILQQNWTSLDKASGATALPRIDMAGGAVIELHNGDTNTRVNADIVVNATDKAAVIRGIDQGSDNMELKGTVSGAGTLQLRSLADDGVRNTNIWKVNSAISDTSGATLGLEIKDVTLTIGGSSASTFSGGTSISNSSVTVNKASAFGSGKLELTNSTVTLGSDLEVGAISGASGLVTGSHDISLTGAKGTATYSGAISGISLAKSGVGVQEFTNVGSLTGVSVTGGGLSLTGSAMELQNVSVDGSGTLTLGGNVSLSSAISSSGTVEFNGASFTLAAADFTNNRYDIVTGSGTTSGSLSYTVTGDTSGTFRLGGMGSGHVYILSGTGELTWDGTTATGGDAWGESNWLLDGSEATFETGDTVHFTSAAAEKDVQVASGGVTVGTMDITGTGYTFSGGKVSATGDLTVAAGASASFASGLSVTGTVSMGANATLTAAGGLTAANGIRVEETRTLGIGTGEVNADITLAGGTLTLADSVSSPTFTLERDSNLRVDGSDSATFSGSMTVQNNAGLTKTGTGTLKLDLATTNADYTVAAGTLQLMQNLTVGDGKNLTVNANGTLSGAGKNLVINTGSGDVTIGGDATLLEVQSKGDTSFTGGTTNVSTLLGVWDGSMSISGASVNAADLVMVDKDDYAKTVSLTIGKDGQLNITGDSHQSLVIAGWAKSASTGTLTVEKCGSLTAENAVMKVSYWDNTTGSVNVNGGSINVKGISFHHQIEADSSLQNGNVRGSLTLSNGGSLTVGSEGIKGVEMEGDTAKVSVTLGDGTIHASADWTMGRFTDGATLVDITLNDTKKGTSFDTDGHTVTIDNNLVGDGALVKEGEGKLKLNGANTYTGSTTVKEGTLALGGSGSLDNGSMTLSAAHSGADATIQSAKIDGTTISGLEGTQGQVANLKVLYNDSKVTFSDMVISADSHIGKEPVARTYGSRLAAADGDTPASTTEAEMRNSKLKLETGEGKNATLSTATSTEVITRNDGKPDIAIGTALSLVECSTFDVDVLSGSLTLDFAGIWDDILKQHTKYIAVEFSNVSSLGDTTDGTVIRACLGNADPVEAISYGSAGGAVVYFEIHQIPEPATATLSLLALALLAARRRRKR